MRPVSKQGRPLTGFQRPGSNRPLTGSGQKSDTAAVLQGNRPGTNRPITSGGRYIRLGTASLSQAGGQFLIAEKLNMKQLATKKGISKAVCDYLIYVEHNIKKALELAAEATVISNYEDWWWKARLGKCYYMLGLYREAEKQFKSSLKNEDMVKTHLELSKIYIRLDQPNTAVEIFQSALAKYPMEVSFILGIGRVYDMLNDSIKAVEFYRKALIYESSNLEAVASLASYHFYTDQPEVALRFYKRLAMLGVNNAELWNNLGLCCFYDGQYDLFYSCMEKALSLAEDIEKADIWYNISHVFVNLGDLFQAYQALKLALSYDVHHAEAINNMGVLEIKKGNINDGKYNFNIAIKEGPFLYEPAFNAALWAMKTGEYQESYALVNKVLSIYPEHIESIELKRQLDEILVIV